MGSGVHGGGCGCRNRPAWTRVVVVGTELAVVVVRSRQLKRRPNLSASAVNGVSGRFYSQLLNVS